MKHRILEMQAIKSVVMCIMLLSTFALITPVASAKSASASEISNFLSKSREAKLPGEQVVPPDTAGRAIAVPETPKQATAPSAATPQNDITSFFKLREKATDLLTATAKNLPAGGGTAPKPSYAPAPQGQGPDLVPDSMAQFTYGDGTWGYETNKKLGITVNIKNVGNLGIGKNADGKTYPSYTVALYYQLKAGGNYDWQLIGKQTIDLNKQEKKGDKVTNPKGQEVGALEAATFVWTIPLLSPGTYSMRAVVDADNNIYELDENNNEMLNAVGINLAHAAKISGTVKDAYNGNGKPLSGASVKATSDGVATETLTDAEGRYSFDSLAPDYTYTITASQDYFAESSTNINIVDGDTKTVDFTLSRNAFPDLAVSADDLKLTRPLIAGQEATFSATVHNLGNAPAENVKVAFTDASSGAENAQITEATIPGIAAGETAVAQYKFTPAESTAEKYLSFTVSANKDKDLEESRYDNNGAQFADKRPVGSTGANLMVKITASNTEPKVGEKVTLTGKVENLAEATGPAADVQVQFEHLTQVGDNIVKDIFGKETISYISPGESVTYKAYFVPEAVGEDYVYIRINTNGQGPSYATPVTLDVKKADLGNRPPVANAGPDRVAGVGDKTTFDAIELGTYDPDDGWTVGSDIKKYEWTFGSGKDAKALSGKVMDYTFASAGRYDVTLKVTDYGGLTGTDKVVITVTQKPVAVVKPASQEVYAGDKAEWDVSGSYDTDDGIAEQSLNYGDSDVYWYSPVYAKYSHIYTNGGEYTFTFKVKDKLGIWSEPATATVKVIDKKADLHVGVITIGNAKDGAGAGSQGQGQGAGMGDGMSSGGGNGQSGNGQQGAGDGAPKDETAYKDQATKISAYVFNDGSRDATAVKVSFYAAGFALGSKEVNIYSGTYEKVSVDWTPKQGGPTALEVRADPDNTVLESNEGNNDLTKVVDVVGNRPPSAELFGPTDGYPHQAYDFDGSGSYDLDGKIVAYAWSFGDESRGASNAQAAPAKLVLTGQVAPAAGTFGAAGTRTYNAPEAPVSGSPTASHTYAKSGTYTVTLTVTDDGWLKDATTLTITITNRAPSVTLGEIPAQAYVGEEVTFTATGTDADGDSLTYSWSFAEGDNANGQAVKHSYAASGNYTYTVTVMDDEGATGQAQGNIEILESPTANKAPVAEAGPDQNVCVNTSVDFDGSGSYDSDGTITAYDWNFGDDTNGTGATPSHTYTAAGNYTVTLKVTDNEGATDTDTLTVSVYDNVLPVAEAGPDKVARTNTSVSFDGSSSYDSDGSISSYSWDFGDNNTDTGAKVNHTYNASGNYTVTLTVTDNEGGKGTDTLTVGVYDNILPTPVIDVSPSTKVNVNKTVYFNASASSDSDGTIASYSWDFGDKNTDTGVTTNHSYNATGNYTVTLTVTDNEGGQANTTVKIEVVAADVDVTPPVIKSKEPSGTVSGLTQILRVMTDETALCAYSKSNVSYDSMIQFMNTNATEHTTQVTATEGSNTYYVLCKDGSGNVMTAPETITFTATVPSSGGTTGGSVVGGGWFGGGIPTVPAQTTISIPTSPAPTAPAEQQAIMLQTVAAYESGALGISRDYYYNPSTNHTIYTLRLENKGNATLRVSIKDVIPKAFAEHVSDFTTRPRPDVVYKDDPEIGWRAVFGPGTVLLISYEFNKYIPLEDIQALAPPVITELPGPTPAATVAQPAAAAAAAPTPVTTILGLAVGVLGNPVSGISAIIFACLACLLYARGRDVEAALRSMRPTRPVTRRQLKLWAKVIIAAAVLLGIAFIYATLTVFGTLLIVLAALAITAIWKGAGFQRALRAIPPGVKAWCIAAAARVRKSLVVRKLAAFWRWFLGTRVGRALGKASAKTVAGWRWLCASRLGRACGWLRRKFLSGCSTLKRWIMGAPEAIAAEMARTERIFELVREVPSEAKEGW